ncbi:ABC transporter permease [Runella zeae]|uniref:ABC transporter permease n=1 Tax=Runella zeae TaxID=94255 RepID=UPI002355CA27|nr:ABC transporter permease [Runella zeae]
MKHKPPVWIDKWLNCLLAPHLREEILGDLHERYALRIKRLGEGKARQRYWRDALTYIRLSNIKRKHSQYPQTYLFSLYMLRNYFKIAFRNLLKYKGYSFINIFGLATGMAVAMLIGLWVWDELSFNKYHKNYDRIAQVWQFVNFDGTISSYNSVPIPMAEELRSKYPDFQATSLSTYTRDVILAAGEKKLTKSGNYVQPVFVDMMSFKMLAGSSDGLKEINTIFLSESVAKAFFGTENPLNKIIRMGNKTDVKVTGVYEDLPYSSAFRDVLFLAPWELFVANDGYAKRILDEWDENSFQVFAQLKEGSSAEAVSAKIKDIRMKRKDPPGYKPAFFLHPMNQWHLYTDFKDGKNAGGIVYFVWLFGAIGVFVLLLACINFMNLSTARSEKRAKEVGIRKSVGSVRGQLIFQFLSESFVITLMAFVIALIFTQLALPFFNEIADKRVAILWNNPWFWLLGLGFSLLTGLIAGSYPALYLSSFQPIRVLKGTFKATRFASVPRKALVVFQFTVSVTLVIGIITVFRQIQHAKDRPSGYERGLLVEVNMNTPELYGHYDALRNDLLNTGAVVEFAESGGSITNQYGGTTNISWKGKTPNTQPLFMANQVTHDFGNTVGWKVIEGRDFSRKFSTDSSAMIINEAALKLMGFKRPIGEIVRSGKEYKVIGVIKNMIRQSPFEPVNAAFYTINYNAVNTISFKLSPQLGTSKALNKVAGIFKKYNPEAPFEYSFVDEVYGRKFSDEERIGKLAAFFALLAVLISCLGLFGLASFIAEQRTKEIGIRKVLGASVAGLWQMLSKDFALLVLIACFIAVPISYYFLNNWLQHYEYRTELSWWIFAVAALGSIVIALLTVSYQAIKAALINPVKSLRSE